MKKYCFTNIRLALLLTALFTVNSYSQSTKIMVYQDPKFLVLLNEKRKINASISINEGYKIQIYTGDSENSKRELARVKTEFNYLESTIIFNTPYYKVWTGNFKTKIDAQRNLKEIHKSFPNSIILKPSK